MSKTFAGIMQQILTNSMAEGINYDFKVPTKPIIKPQGERYTKQEKALNTMLLKEQMRGTGRLVQPSVQMQRPQPRDTRFEVPPELKDKVQTVQVKDEHGRVRFVDSFIGSRVDAKVIVREAADRARIDMDARSAKKKQAQIEASNRGFIRDTEFEVRRCEMVELFLAGEKRSDIAKRFRITHTAVTQAVMKQVRKVYQRYSDQMVVNHINEEYHPWSGPEQKPTRKDYRFGHDWPNAESELVMVLNQHGGPSPIVEDYTTYNDSNARPWSADDIERSKEIILVFLRRYYDEKVWPAIKRVQQLKEEGAVHV